jgi:hypothetical protein
MILFLLFIAQNLFANEMASAPKIAKNSAPICWDQVDEINKIKETQIANKKTKFKYKGYEELFQKAGLSDEEIFARLIFAETKASHCKDPQTTKTIAEVISNRIQKRNANVRSVVFENDQFASSLNFYTGSAKDDFLCPKDAKTWAEAMQLATKLMQDPTSNTLSKDAVHYYFFQHLASFKPPIWTKAYKSSRELGSCMTAYENPKWK